MAKWVFPFPDSTLTGHFGKVRKFRGAPTNPHRGTDWAPGAKPIIAVTKGTIKVVRFSSVMGWGVVHTGWADGKTWYVGYHHLDCPKCGAKCKGNHDNPFPIKEGDKVEGGKPIPGLKVGNTGSATSGRHCHATLSRTPMGGWSGKVYDLYAMIKSQQPTPKPAAKPAAKTAAVKTIYACPHCKKELK